MKWMLPLLLLLTLPAMAQTPTCPPKTREESFYNIGLLYARGDTRGALAAIECVLRDAPTSAEALLLRGQINLEIGNRDAALADFNAVLEQHPDEARAFIGRGLVAMFNGWDDLAFQDFDTALRHDPTFAQAHYQRGQAAARLGEVEMAIRDFRSAIHFGFTPEREALWQIALIYDESGDVEAQEAILRQITRTDNFFAPAFEQLGELLNARGDYSEGFAYLHRATVLAGPPPAPPPPLPDPATAARNSFLQWMPLMLFVLIVSGLIGGGLIGRRRQSAA